MSPNGGVKDEDLLFAQYTSLSGQLAQQRKLGMMAEEAASEEVAKNQMTKAVGNQVYGREDWGYGALRQQ